MFTIFIISLISAVSLFFIGVILTSLGTTLKSFGFTTSGIITLVVMRISWFIAVVSFILYIIEKIFKISIF